ncbi:sigma factor [Actinocatenispora sera]|uniref:sigma factor n=1 Tax=Actinocatenispora sera TaxID=390989 RepID=UPI0033D8A7C1
MADGDVGVGERRFREYVRGQQAALRRTAYLLCGDWHQADDLVQTALTKLFLHWRRASRADNLDAYAHTVLVRVYIDEPGAAVAVGAAAAALLVGAGVAGATVTRGGTHRADPAASATPSPAMRTAPTSFAPMVQTLAVGASGDRLTNAIVDVTTEMQSLSAGYDAASTGTPEVHVSVKIYPRGSRYGAQFAGQGRPAAPVHGRPARCLTAAGKLCQLLAFQYLPGAWGAVGSRPGDPDPVSASRIRALAQTVHLTRPQPMTAPFRLTGHFAGWTPTATSTNRVLRSGRLSLVHPGGSNRSGRYDVDIVVRANDPERDATNTTVDGCPASRFSDPDGSSGLDVYRPDGTSVSIRLAAGVHLDLRQLYRALHVVDRPDDLATWVAPLP